MILMSRLTCLPFDQDLLFSEMTKKIRPEEWEQLTLDTVNTKQV